MDRNIAWVMNVVLLGLGVVFTVQALQIPGARADAIGPRLVPLSISIAVLVLGAVISALQYFRKSPDPYEQSIELGSVLFYVGPLLLLVIAYALMLDWFGYLIPTVLCAFVALRLFNNSVKLSLVNAVVGGAIFYLTFIKLMGIYDPPGTIIDISNLFIW